MSEQSIYVPVVIKRLINYKMRKKLLKTFDLYNFFLYKYLVTFKRYKMLNIADNITNGIFKVFIVSRDGKNVVFKIPKRKYL